MQGQINDLQMDNDRLLDLLSKLDAERSTLMVLTCPPPLPPLDNCPATLARPFVLWRPLQVH